MLWRLKFQLIFLLILVCGCSSVESLSEHPLVDRESRIPLDQIKRQPDQDQYPPILHSSEFEAPIPLLYPINTAGLEDSPFILSDGKTLYFFFTPDAAKSPQEQLFDEVTGIWVAQKSGAVWETPRRIWLHEPGKLALDGATWVKDNQMWFASVREGFSGMNMFTAELIDGRWLNWQYAGDRLMKEIQIGEVHLHGDELYFHSSRPGGVGNFDIWITTHSAAGWSDPINIAAVNTPELDGYPWVSEDGSELWFTRFYQGSPAILRSLKIAGEWSQPELILSQFAGEPTLDASGNLYFVHHFFEFGRMIESDIYLALRK